MSIARIDAQRWRMIPRLVGAALLIPTAVAAQEPLGQPLDEPVPGRTTEQERCVCTGGFEGFGELHPMEMFGDRPRIGIMIGEPDETDGRAGAQGMEVVEGGPAYRAGLERGDVIVTLEGTDLEAPDELVERMEEVEAGDTVTIVAYRDGERRTFRVVPEAGGRILSLGGDHMMRIPVPDREELRRIQRRVRRVAPMLERAAARVDDLDFDFEFGFDDLELVEMNDGLARYFGTEDGVLVTDVDEDSELGLRPGDVLLSIGGRQVRDARHARSIIQSYRPDEEIRLEVMRDNRRITVRGERDG